MTAVLLATCAALPSGDEDAPALGRALARHGLDVRWQAWDDASASWDGGLTVLRSTWDYTPRREAFLDWARSVPRLANAAATVAWNSDKTYLRDLAAAGIPIVPTEWLAPGESIALPVEGEFVIKPSVGAGSKGAGRFGPAATDDARRHALDLHDAGRVVLVQPYLAGVDTAGETALIYVDGAFSHAITKAAMLPSGAVYPVEAGPDSSLFVAERIRARVPSAAELALGERVMHFVSSRLGAHPLYARVDLLPAPDGPVVIELELVEPSLFLGYADGAAERFAAAIAERASAA